MQWFSAKDALLKNRQELAFAGVYAVAVPKDALATSWAMIRNDKWLIYIGKSDLNLGDRLRNHLFSSSAYSRLRQSLGLLTVYQQSNRIVLKRHSFHFGDLEGELTSMIIERASLFVSRCKNPLETEGNLIAALASELNMKSRYHSPSAVLLRRLRTDALSQHVRG